MLKLEVELICEGREPNWPELQRAISTCQWHEMNTVNWDTPTTPTQVHFQMAHSKTHLFWHYNVRESHVRSMETQPNSSVCLDSCVECFFGFGAQPQAYFNLEINATGVVHCFSGPDRSQRTPLPLESIAEIKTLSSLGELPFDNTEAPSEWNLLVMAPLRVFGLGSDADLSQGARANFYKCGDRLPHPHYLTWNPVGTPRPDFHQPDYFGELSFA